MKLLTKEIEAGLPAFYSQEAEADPMVRAKFFTPWTFWTWYVLEFNPEERLCFGYVEGLENELGYFSLDELEALRGPGDLRIERDLYFKPCRLSEVRAGGAK